MFTNKSKSKVNFSQGIQGKYIRKEINVPIVNVWNQNNRNKHKSSSSCSSPSTISLLQSSNQNQVNHHHQLHQPSQSLVKSHRDLKWISTPSMIASHDPSSQSQLSLCSLPTELPVTQQHNQVNQHLNDYHNQQQQQQQQQQQHHHDHHHQISNLETIESLPSPWNRYPIIDRTTSSLSYVYINSSTGQWSNRHPFITPSNPPSQLHQTLVPANPWNQMEIPDWLIVYSFACPSNDHLLKWELFKYNELDAFQAMLNRLYRLQAEQIVIKFEFYRAAIQRELHKRINNNQTES